MPENMQNLPVKVAELNLPERINSGGVMLGRTGGEAWVAPKSEFSLRDILYVIFRHKWKIVLTFFVLSFATMAYVASMPQVYESEARILIGDDRNGITVDPTGEGNGFLKGNRGGGSMRTEMGIVMSPILAEEVVKRLGAATVLGLDAQTPGPAAATGAREGGVKRLAAAFSGLTKRAFAALHLEPPKMTLEQMAVQSILGGIDAGPTASESMVLRVALRSRTPETARRVLDALVEAYQQEHILVHKSQVSPEFFKGKAEELKRQLAEKENTLEAERKRLNVSSLENQKAMLLNQYATFDTALKENAMRITSLQAKIGQLDKIGNQQPKTGTVKSVPRANPATDQLRSRYIELKLKETDMASRLTDKNPELIEVRRQITSLQTLIAGQAAGDKGLDTTIAEADPMRQEMERQGMLAKMELEAENARTAMLIKALNDTREQLNTLQANEKTLKQLEREVGILEAEYKQYMQGMQTAEMSTALDRDKISNVSVVQRATLPIEPVKSQRKLLALVGFGIFLSLLAGVAWAFALEYCDHSLKTSEDVERRLGLPVLVAIPKARRHQVLLREGSL